VYAYPQFEIKAKGVVDRSKPKPLVKKVVTPRSNQANPDAKPTEKKVIEVEKTQGSQGSSCCTTF
jgi:hypothetical protein